MQMVKEERLLYAFPIDFYEEQEGWTAESVDLGIASCGDDRNEAFAAVTEAISLHIESLLEDGELDDFLSERNLNPTLATDLLPDKNYVYVGVPVKVHVECSGTLYMEETNRPSWGPQANEVSFRPETNHFVLV